MPPRLSVLLLAPECLPSASELGALGGGVDGPGTGARLRPAVDDERREAKDENEALRASETGCATSGNPPGPPTELAAPPGFAEPVLIPEEPKPPDLARERDDAYPREWLECTLTASASARNVVLPSCDPLHPLAGPLGVRGAGARRLTGPRWRRVSVESSRPLNVSCRRCASASTSSISWRMSAAETRCASSVSSDDSRGGWRATGVASAAPRNADGGPALAPIVAKRRDEPGVRGEGPADGGSSQPARRRLLLERGKGPVAPFARMDASLVLRPSRPVLRCEPEEKTLAVSLRGVPEP